MVSKMKTIEIRSPECPLEYVSKIYTPEVSFVWTDSASLVDNPTARFYMFVLRPFSYDLKRNLIYQECLEYKGDKSVCIHLLRRDIDEEVVRGYFPSEVPVFISKRQGYVVREALRNRGFRLTRSGILLTEYRSSTFVDSRMDFDFAKNPRKSVQTRMWVNEDDLNIAVTFRSKTLQYSANLKAPVRSSKSFSRGDRIALSIPLYGSDVEMHLHREDSHWNLRLPFRCVTEVHSSETRFVNFGIESLFQQEGVWKGSSLTEISEGDLVVLQKDFALDGETMVEVLQVAEKTIFGLVLEKAL